MTGLKFPRSTAFLASALVFGVASGLSAQSSGPIDQEPTPLAPVATAPIGAPAVEPPQPAIRAPVNPRSLTPTTAPAQPPVSVGTPVTAGLGPVKIEIEQLERIDADSVGTLSGEDGGLGIGMWSGTLRTTVEALLPKLPVNSASRTMREMMRRLLLSKATAPEGESKTSQSLIAMRVELLAGMGDVDAVQGLIAASPPRDRADALHRSEADALLLNNDNARVCPLVASRIQDQASAFWRKAFIFCQALAGEHDKAALGSQLLRETGDEDKVFFSLVDQLAGFKGSSIESLVDPRPLHFAMARAAKVELPADVTTSNNPAVLRTVATTPNLHPELRVDAAERAEIMGALPTDVLRSLYTGVTFTNEALENPLTTAATDRSPLSRALLYRKSLLESVPTARAGVLSQALTLAREGGYYQSAARVYVNILKEIEPSRDLVWFASEAVRAFLAAGDLDNAAPWLEIIRSSASFDAEAIVVRDGLTPLARLAGAVPDEDWNPDVLINWQASQRREEDGRFVNDEQVQARSLLLFSLLESLGTIVPDRFWAELLASPPQSAAVMPQPAIWRSLDNAVENVRIGETVMLSLVALGQAGPTQADPTVLRKVLTSLRYVGLGDEARSLALEAAVAAGL